MKTFNEINYDNYQYVNYHQNKEKIIENFVFRTFRRGAAATLM